jgi:hypothetical protein
MSYTAQPPAPGTVSREFTVVIRAEKFGDSAEALEMIIADTVAARLGFEVTVDFIDPIPPF